MYMYIYIYIYIYIAVGIELKMLFTDFDYHTYERRFQQFCQSEFIFSTKASA